MQPTTSKMISRPDQADQDFDQMSIESFPSSATLHSSSSSISESSAGSLSFSCPSGASSSSLGAAAGYCSARTSLSTSWLDSVDTKNRNKPHKANQASWEAIRCLRAKDGGIGLNHFKLLRKLGSGDLGSVYLCQLRSRPGSLFAMKVVDKEAMAYRDKLHRAEVEKQILSTLDHPFLPTLYAHFDASHYSCLVMEFCPGGDLHSLRQQQLLKRFSLRATRFYAAELLVALEYLHMMGVIYRDLKPENVLVREDGHIMLSDFDLSLRCDAVATLEKTTKADNDLSLRSPPGAACSNIDPVISCFFPSSSSSSNKTKRSGRCDPRPELVAEPKEARSKSFVGTHEYLAPEVISGQGHGSPVDWYTLGIFIYELLYGRTPFRGSNNEATLTNIVTQPLRFPERVPKRDREAWEAARDLIKKLLVRDPRRRLGSSRGASEIKGHPFFKGIINWALIRSMVPPQVQTVSSAKKKHQQQAAPALPRFDYF